ncbi:MAG: addiction module protein [Ignavibacteriaceae bacterium]|jgi:putative addiction module component (TIGR02574 family)|nr:addiction module protein [Ignavibacteriaceae bacterium]
METKKIIDEVISLPVEERALIADSILRSLNPADSDIDKKWIKIAKDRLNDLKSGKVKAIPGDEVFNKIWKKFST